jgi:hypothetical protein
MIVIQRLYVLRGALPVLASLAMAFGARADTLPPLANHHPCQVIPAIVPQTGFTQGSTHQIALNLWLEDNDWVHFNRLMENSSHTLSWDSDGNDNYPTHPTGDRLNNAYTTPALLVMPDGGAMAVVSRAEGEDSDRPYFQFFPFEAGSQELDSQNHPAQYSYKLPEGNGAGPYTDNSFAAANLPDGTGFVTIRCSDNSRLYVDYWRWEDFPGLDTILQQTFPVNSFGTSVAPYFSQTVALPGGVQRNNINGNVGMAITTNYDRMARWYPYRLTIGVSPGNGGATQVREWRLNNKMPKTSLATYFLTPPPRDAAWHAVGTRSDGEITVHQGDDGAVYLAELNRPGTSNDGSVEIWKRTGYDYTTQAPTWGLSSTISGTTTHRAVPAFFYRQEDWASPQYNATTGTFPTGGQISFPVTRLAVFNYDLDYSGMGGDHGSNSDTNQSDYTCAVESAFAVARRRVLDETAENTAGNVVGIFEGPPPLPNENIPLGSDVYYEVAQVNYGTTQSSQSDFSTTLTRGVSAALKVSAGFELLGVGAKVDVGFELEQTWGSATSTESETQREGTMSETSFLAPDGNGGYIINPQGTLFIQKQTFTGFAYEMLPPGSDPNNSAAAAMDGSRIFYTRIPTGEYVKAVDYWINPNAVRPGVLDSYIVTPDERSQLNAMAIKLGDGSASSIPFSWTKQGQAKSAFNTWAQTTNTQTSSLDVGVSVGVTMNSPVLDIESSVGTSMSTEREWSTAQNNGYGLQIANFYVPVDPNAPNTYQSYSFSTYLLADSNDFTKELLSQDPDGAGLVTQTWPTDPKMRSDNEKVREQILGSSRPWKVTYALNGVPLESVPLAGLSAAVRLDPALRAKLTRLGVTNTAQLDLLLSRLQQDGEDASPVRIGNSIHVLDRAGLAAKRNARPQLDAALRAAFPPAADVQHALRAISPAEAAALRQMLANVRAAQRRAYDAAHPRVYPRVPPPGVVNSPSYRSPYAPLFTATPPPGL